MEKLTPIKSTQAVCLCCGGAHYHLPMDTVLYSGFGGWQIFKDGGLFYQADPNTAEWDSFRRLEDIEKDAALLPECDWQAVCFTPLHGETYQRQDGKWVLVEQNEGFA